MDMDRQCVTGVARLLGGAAQRRSGRPGGVSGLGGTHVARLDPWSVAAVSIFVVGGAPSSHTLSYTHHEAGRVTGISTPAENAERYAYDALGRLSEW